MRRSSRRLRFLLTLLSLNALLLVLEFAGKEGIFDAMLKPQRRAIPLIILRSANGGTRRAPQNFSSNPRTPANKADLFSRNLRVGDRGGDVLRLQQILNANPHTSILRGAGSKGKETEKFNLQTRSALIRFQRYHGINLPSSLRGTAEERTRQALEEAAIALMGNPVTPLRRVAAKGSSSRQSASGLQHAAAPSSQQTISPALASTGISSNEQLSNANTGASEATSSQSSQKPSLATPTNLLAVPAMNIPKIKLTWTDNSDTEDEYVIERSIEGTTFTELARVSRNTASYDDLGLAASTAYAYRVKAYSASTQPSATASVSATTANFRVFDGTLFSNKLEMTQAGMENIYLAYANKFVNNYYNLPDKNYERAEEEPTRAVARDAANKGATTFVIDIEHWPLNPYWYPDANIAANVDKFKEVIAWIRSERPELKIGIFDGLPVNDTRIVFGNPAAASAVEADSNALRPLADSVDIIFPALYFDDLNGETWRRRAEADIKHARSYGKPVYPFLWYGLTPDWRPAPADLFRLALATSRQFADGIVVWGGTQKNMTTGAYSNETWNSNDSWWQSAHAFIDGSADKPTPPDGLAAISSPSGGIDLSWQDRSNGKTGFVIERSGNGTAFFPIAIVGPGVTQFHDDGWSGQRFLGTVKSDNPRYDQNGRYAYRVRAQGWPSDSSPSATSSATLIINGLARIEAEYTNEISKENYVSRVMVSTWTSGGWFKYSNVDFGGGTTSFTANLASAATTARNLELHIDAPDGPLIGTLPVQNTGSNDTFQSQTTSVAAASGVHDLYLVLPLTFGQIDWFKFE